MFDLTHQRQNYFILFPLYDKRTFMKHMLIYTTILILATMHILPVYAGNDDSSRVVPVGRMTNEAYASFLESDGWPIDSLNTAKDASYLSDEEKNMVLAMNLIRYDPVLYAELYVKPTIAFFRGKEYHYPGLGYIFITNEGARPAQELYNELVKTSPLPLFYPSQGLSQASKSHARYQSLNGGLGHDGQGGTRARIEREGNWQNRIAENIAYGNTSAHHAILSLMIDDGVPNRGHRINMLHPTYKVVGVAWDTHPRYPGGGYVIKYAGGFTEKNE
jgi:hypothetical protein